MYRAPDSKKSKKEYLIRPSPILKQTWLIWQAIDFFWMP